MVAIKPASRAPGTGKGIWMAPAFADYMSLARPAGHARLSLVVRDSPELSKKARTVMT
jgi:hypothetical protein